MVCVGCCRICFCNSSTLDALKRSADMYRILYSGQYTGRLRFGSVRAVSQKSFGSTVSVHVSGFFTPCRFSRCVPCQEIPSGSAVSVQAVQRFSRFGSSAGSAVQPVQASLWAQGERPERTSPPGPRESGDFVETEQKQGVWLQTRGGP